MSTSRALRGVLACLAIPAGLVSCADAASTMAPVVPQTPTPPSTPPTPTPPPTSGTIERIFIADTSGTVQYAFGTGVQPSWYPSGYGLAFHHDGKVWLGDYRDDSWAIADGGTPAWSPDGSRVAITNADGIAVVDVATRNVRVIVRHDFRTDTYREWDMGVAKPSWSPDGTLIAFEHLGDFDMVMSQIFVVPAAGGTPRRLTRNPSRVDYPETDPAFSPDGRRVAYWSLGHGIATARLDDGIPVSLYPPFPGVTFGARPSWSHDGKRIAFNIRRGTSRLVAVIDATGGAFRELIPDAWDAVWSPNGKDIAFVSTREP
jgi:Tol biopolymer transport system component